MKKTLSIIFCLILMISASPGCSVLSVGETHAEYFGYVNDIKEDANLVFYEFPSNARIFDNLMQEFATQRILPVFDVSTVFFDDGELSARFNVLYNNYFSYMNLWENRVFAFYIGSGISDEAKKLFYEKFSESLPGIKIFVSSDSGEGFDGYIVEQGDTLPQRDVIFLKTDKENLSSAYELSCSDSRISGIFLEGESGGIFAEKIIQKNVIDKDSVFAPNVKYFGYYHSGGFAGSEPLYAEVAAMGNSNLAFLEGSTVSELENALIECSENGFKAFFYINFFFVWKNGEQVLNDNWEEVYASYKVLFDKYGDDIFAFYVDEPKWNSINEESFRTATKTLREDYPEKRMLAVLAVPSLGKENASYFEFCTDLGYDYYGMQSEAKRMEYLLLFSETAAYGQDLWLVPWACEINGATEDLLLEDLRACYDLAKKYNKIVGLLPFTYANADIGTRLGDWGKGFMEYSNPESEYYMPELTAEHLRIGKEICGY